MAFVHLHVHTHYSLLESTIKIPDLMQCTEQRHMPAVAMTDHGNMFGAVDFYLAAKQASIKPILGCEIFYTKGSRFTKPEKTSRKALRTSKEDFRNFRLVLLCKNNEGYRNLCELVSRGFTEGFYIKPRVDRELIEKYSAGLIALTSGLKSEAAYSINSGQPEEAENVILWLLKVFKDDLYLELQENGLPEQAKLNSWICDFAKARGLPTVATADVHYLEKKHAQAHEVLQCIGAGFTLDEERPRLYNDEFWLKDEQTILKQFHWNPEAVHNTALVANKCNFSFRLKDEKGRPIYHLPDYHPGQWSDHATAPPAFVENQKAFLKKYESQILTEDRNFSVEAFLRICAQEGLGARLTTVSSDKHELYLTRLNEELEMIIQTGFAGYFLIVADFIGFAKSVNIPVGPGRGSGAGSLVAYALQITDIDPIEFNLLFERFINPERISMPDFDVDFCQNRRQEVIDYVVQKYGRSNVSQIITFGKLLARGVVRDTGRVMGLSYAEVDQLAKLIPEELGITLEHAFEKEKKLQDLTDSNIKINKLFETARALEGINRHASVHAAGVVITSNPLVEYCPLYIGKEGESVVQFDKDFAEKIGLIKFDFLGLKTLTVIDNAVKFIRETQSEKGILEDQRFSIQKIPYNDSQVYKLISRGDTDGVFQLESSGMKDLCIRVQPSRIEDLTAINALYRPGPLNSGMVDDYINRKHGKTPVVYELSQLAEILEETYGVIVYQEQVMRIARVLANYTLGEADLLRRAMGKKKPAEMAKQRDKFISGCLLNNISAEKAERLFELLAKFAEYGFNKSHSAAYSVLSYQTAYLKTYYPAQFMAALMATEMDNTEKITQYISDAKKHKIFIFPPDVNASKKTFSVVEDEGGLGIRFGLEAIKGVGGVAVDAILEERVRSGKFKNFLDFCTRVTLRKVNKKVLESLISVGAFDAIAEVNRATLFESVEFVIQYAGKLQEQTDLGQVSMFDQYQAHDLKLETNADHLFKKVSDWPESKKLQLERSLVGFYVSGHPIEKWQVLIKQLTQGDIEWVKNQFLLRRERISRAENKNNLAEIRSELIVCGVVSSFREITTKKGALMAFFELEDDRSKIECICFPEVYQTCAAVVKQSMQQCECVLLSGGFNLEEESPKLFVRSLDLLVEYQKKRIQSVILLLDLKQIDSHRLALLRATLVKYPGRCSTFIEYRGVLNGVTMNSRYALPKELSVHPSSEMMLELNELFGSEVVRLL